jgi:hypothetical protein
VPGRGDNYMGGGGNNFWCCLACGLLELYTITINNGALYLILWHTTYILSRVCGDYMRRVLDWQLDLLDHTQLQCIHPYSFTVHYSRVKPFSEPSYLVGSWWRTPLLLLLLLLLLTL